MAGPFLEENDDFVARDSTDYAARVVERIPSTAALLAESPQRGELLPEFPELIYRQFVVGSYHPIYREDCNRDRILIMGVIHGRRDFPPRWRGDSRGSCQDYVRSAVGAQSLRCFSFRGLVLLL